MTIARCGRLLSAFPKPQNEEAYNRVLAQRSELQAKLNAMRLDARNLVAHWLASQQGSCRAVSTDGLIVRLRLDEGSGEVLKNSAPNRKSRKLQDNDDETGMGRDHMAVARLPHAVQHASAAWTDWRLRSEPCISLRAVGSCSGRRRFIPASFGTLMSKMDSTQHDRGWELAADDNGNYQRRSGQSSAERRQAKKKEGKKALRQKATSREGTVSLSDSTGPDKKDLAPNKPPEQLKAEKREKRKSEGGGRSQSEKVETQRRSQTTSTPRSPSASPR